MPYLILKGADITKGLQRMRVEVQMDFKNDNPDVMDVHKREVVRAVTETIEGLVQGLMANCTTEYLTDEQYNNKITNSNNY